VEDASADVWVRIDTLMLGEDLEIPPGTYIAMNAQKHRYQAFYPGAKAKGYRYESASWAWAGVSLGERTEPTRAAAYKKCVLWLREVHQAPTKAPDA